MRLLSSRYSIFFPLLELWASLLSTLLSVISYTIQGCIHDKIFHDLNLIKFLRLGTTIVNSLHHLFF